MLSHGESEEILCLNQELGLLLQAFVQEVNESSPSPPPSLKGAWFSQVLLQRGRIQTSHSLQNLIDQNWSMLLIHYLLESLKRNCEVSFLFSFRLRFVILWRL